MFGVSFWSSAQLRSRIPQRAGRNRNCLAAVVDHADSAVCELEGNERGINVAGLTDARIDRTEPTALPRNFAACEEAGHIEVMDHHIIEDTAGNLDVGYRRRLRIAGGNLDDVDLADLAVTNHVVNCAVVVVERRQKPICSLTPASLAALMAA